VRENLLPGGVATRDGLHKGFVFRPLTGEVELMLSEWHGSNMPDAVSHCLSTALDEVGGKKANLECMAALSVGDRHHLMRRLQILLDGDSGWYSASCSQCHSDFDFQLNLSQLPVKAAGEGYPFVDVATSAGRCRFRVPNGSDQSALAQYSDGEQACAELLRRCLVSVDGVQTDTSIVFSVADKEKIEIALDAVAPDIGCEISVACVTCHANNSVALNPYAFIGKASQHIIPEIHKIAWYYHWGEDEILRMPRQRRRRYLDMIDVSRGVGNSPPDGH